MVNSVKASKPASIYAKFETVLFEFIEPLVVLLKRGKSFYIGSAMPANDGIVEEYFVVSVSPKFLKRYLNEDCDLRYLFLSAQNRRFYRLRIEELSKKKVKLDGFEGIPDDDWLPEAQFFASCHTEEYYSINFGPVEKETLRIDGNWEMEDFGSFSRKLRDLYAFEDSLVKIVDSNSSESIVAKIKSAFTGKPFKGGSSYVNFFRELVSVQPREERFDLSRIAYASPGHIELAGKGEIFGALESRIENFVANEGILRNRYNSFHKYMSDAYLLDIQRTTSEISSVQKDKIELFSRHLLDGMDMNLFDSLHELSEYNIVNTAKITLALYRRMHSTSRYFAEGRVAYDK